MSQSSKIWVVFGILVTAIAVGWGMHKLDNTTSANADGSGDSPTATTTAVAPTATPNPGDKGQPPQAGACQPGDKVGTWSEVSGAGPQRIEVGGHGLQHLDFYTQPGVKAVSFVVPPIANPNGVPNLAYGFGSMWEWNPPGCVYDIVKDTTAYAKARLDSGHSGLVVEWGTWKVLANVANMSQSDIDALLATDKAAMKSSASTSSGTCKGAEPVHHDPTKDAAWEVGPTNSFRVVNVWSNQRDPNLEDHKILLKPGESASFLGGGGDVTVFPANCSDAAQAAYNTASKNPAISLAQYKAYVDNGTMP